MGFIKVEVIERKKCSWFICDQCNKKYCKIGFDKHANKTITFCTKKCLSIASRKGNVLYNIKKEKSIKKYGVENPMQSKEVQNKAKKTTLERHGVENVFQSEEMQIKAKQIFFERYGFENPMDSKEIRNKIEKTNVEKYGSINPFGSNKIKEKIKKTNLKKYGVEYPLQNKKVQEKTKKTNLEKYGVENPTQNKEIQKKVHETKKRNGSYGKSIQEDKYYKCLCLDYGKEDIERQKRINGWSIDFHIKSKNLYIQFDGVYYHGLDRPLEEIKKFKTDTDKVIYGTMLRDIAQNKWFKNNNMTLIRVREDSLKAGEMLDV